MIWLWLLSVSIILPGVTATVTSVQLDLEPTSLILVLDPSDAASLQEQTTANASTMLSNTSLSDLQKDNGTQLLQLRYRERKKQERLFHIQTQILQRLGISRQPNITMPVFSDEERRRMTQIFERMRQMRSHPQINEVERPLRLYAARMQSFYPSCTLPNNTERESWEDPSSFRIFYDIAFPRPSSSTEISIMSAKLRVYKVRDPDPNFITWESELSALPRYSVLDILRHPGASNGISVSVYQYIKPIRMNKREKKRLVDSRTISADHRGWIEFNLISSLSYWFHNRNKNYGIEIEVEDAFGNKLNPFAYFRNMNCTTESASQDPPFPNIMEIHPDMGENESSLFDNETYPTLDLQTAELTREDPILQASEVSGRLLRKRHTGINHGNHKKPHMRCRREHTYITFRELGLDDIIIEPEGFHHSFCTGWCFDHHHTSWFRLFRHQKNWHQSSCVASDYSSLPVLYVDSEGQMREMILENIIARDCLCSNS